MKWWWCCNDVENVSWHTLDRLIQSEHYLRTTASLNIATDCVRPFMATTYPPCNGRIMCTKPEKPQIDFLNMTVS